MADLRHQKMDQVFKPGFEVNRFQNRLAFASPASTTGEMRSAIVPASVMASKNPSASFADTSGGEPSAWTWTGNPEAMEMKRQPEIKPLLKQFANFQQESLDHQFIAGGGFQWANALEAIRPAVHDFAQGQPAPRLRAAGARSRRDASRSNG